MSDQANKSATPNDILPRWDGDQYLTWPDATLPARCALCGQKDRPLAARVHPVKFNPHADHTPAATGSPLDLIFLPFALLSLISMAGSTRKSRVTLYECESCRSSYRQAWTLFLIAPAVIGVGIAIGAWLIGRTADEPLNVYLAGVGLGFILLVVWAIIGGHWFPAIQAAAIDDRVVRLRGIHPKCDPDAPRIGPAA